jgi:hypothetical protein
VYEGINAFLLAESLPCPCVPPCKLLRAKRESVATAKLEAKTCQLEQSRQLQMLYPTDASVDNNRDTS